MGIVTIRRPSISWCTGGQDQALVEKECHEETISSVCSGKAERPTTSRRYELELSNRFTVFQEDLFIEEKWELFSTSVKASADTVIEREEAQTESAGYQTEPGTLSMSGRRQKIRHLRKQKHRLKLSTIENLTRR